MHARLQHSIQALLSAPNPDDPLAENIAKHWKENEAEAVAMGALVGCVQTSAAHQHGALTRTSPPRPAREWTRLYAQSS